jgi:hypothetical protein
MWSDLFLADASVINFNNGDVTLTHSANTLTVGGGVLVGAFAVGSDAAGDVLYSDGTNYVRLAKGSDDEVLTLASGVPSWAAASGGGNAHDGDTTIANGFGLIVGHTALLAMGGDTPEMQVAGTAAADSQIGIMRSNAGVAGSILTLAHTRDALGTYSTALVANDQAGQIRFAGSDTTDATSFFANITAYSTGTTSANSSPGYLVFATTTSGQDPSEKMRIDSAGNVIISSEAELWLGPAAASGNQTHANMNVGIVVNMEANGGHALAFKDSDLAHGSTTTTVDCETDDWLTISERSSYGGATFNIKAANSAVQTPLLFWISGGIATTTKTIAAEGLHSQYYIGHNGSNGRTAVTANGNLFSLRTHYTTGTAWQTRFLVDEDGDMWTATSGQTFDDYDDVALIEAYDHVRSGDAKFQIRSEFGKFAYANEAALVEAGVLGSPMEEGPLTNHTQLIRVLTGAARQQAERIRQLETTVAGLLPAGE